MADSFIPNPHPFLARYAANDQQLVDFLAWTNDGFVINDKHLLAGRPDIVTIRLLPEAATQAKITPRGWIKHSQAGTRQATNEQLWGFLERASNLEPHIIGPEMIGGRVIQCIPFNVRADCNYHGNFWWEGRQGVGYLSMETQDEGAEKLPTTPWSLPQLNVMAAIDTATTVAYEMACHQPAHDRDAGIGHHTLYSTWSAYVGKTCPGAARIYQMDWLRGEVATRVARFWDAVNANGGVVGRVA